jgi:YspA, cpYpsA-related SLOG family
MRILVTGSRDWNLLTCLATVLQIVAADSGVLIVHGACPTGADALADAWAREHGIPVERHPADWGRYGKAAGPRRNAEMVAAGANACLAFIRNESRGASHCAALAEAAGIDTYYYRSLS